MYLLDLSGYTIELDKEGRLIFKSRALVFFPTGSMALGWLVNAVSGGSLRLA
jgi:hypothetical protein